MYKALSPISQNLSATLGKNYRIGHGQLDTVFCASVSGAVAVRSRSSMTMVDGITDMEFPEATDAELELTSKEIAVKWLAIPIGIKSPSFLTQHGHAAVSC